MKLPALLPMRVLPPLTMLLLLVNTADNGLLFTPLAAWFALGVALPRLLRTPLFWYVTATILGTAVWCTWESADNHRYLFVYWTLALFSAFSLPRGEQPLALALTGRWLLGLCMLLAVAWKCVSPDYLSGSFFHYELLADERFAHFTSWTSGLSLEQLAENRALRESLTSGALVGKELSEVQFHSSAGVATVAQLLTWWTVGIEGLLAAFFLGTAIFPRRPRLILAANLALLTFAATTYAIAPVRGFGGILMLLGLAQCEGDQKRFRYAFLAAFVLTQLSPLPLMDLLALLA
ncbi:MAG: hypothetical protein K8R36_18095 [Planctomycetales bacterium]|nr:hypothetical protein [Planctomycetales bacterium]